MRTSIKEFNDLEYQVFGEMLSVKIYLLQIASEKVYVELMHDLTLRINNEELGRWDIVNPENAMINLKLDILDRISVTLHRQDYFTWSGTVVKDTTIKVFFKPILPVVDAIEIFRYRQMLDAELAKCYDFPSKKYSGKGIVIPGGGEKYFVCAWVLIHVLRNELNCQLPIELWYLGEQEMTKSMGTAIAKLNVTLRDALKVEGHCKLHGWALKPFSIIHSSFNDVLFLDSDNIPVKNPKFLFDTEQYHETGALFWPDFGRLDHSRAIWNICRVIYRNEPEIESGQMVINKSKCWKALHIALHMNLNSVFYYKYILGDKETFHMAWRIFEQGYSMNPFRIDPIQNTMCQHDFEGKRLFQHRNYDKWNLNGNDSIASFQFEKQCFSYLKKLKNLIIKEKIAM